MILERPDLIDRFANYFVSDTARNWYFQPRPDWPPLPVSEGEMLDGVERYRRRSMMAMAALWITFFAAFLWFCWTAFTDANAVGVGNVLAFPLAFLVGFVAHQWALRASFRPFHRRLLEYVEDRHRSGAPVGSPHILLPKTHPQLTRQKRQGTWWRGD